MLEFIVNKKLYCLYTLNLLKFHCHLFVSHSCKQFINVLSQSYTLGFISEAELKHDSSNSAPNFKPRLFLILG